MALALYLCIWSTLCYFMGLRSRASANASLPAAATKARNHVQRGGASAVGPERQPTNNQSASAPSAPPSSGGPLLDTLRDETKRLAEKVPTLKEALALQAQVRVFVATLRRRSQLAAGGERKGAASPVGTAIAPAQPASVASWGSNAQPLRYNRALHTGFGDRLSVLLNVAAAAATLSRDVYVFWHEGSGTPKHHSVLSLDEVEKYVVWPKNLKVLPRDEFDMLFHSEKLAGKFGDIVFTTDNNQSILPGISR